MLIPRKGIARGIVFGVLFFVGAVAIAQRCCRAFFGAYFQLGFLTGMTGQVAGDFLGTALSVILRNLWFFPLALAPAVLFAIFRKRLVPQQQEGRSTRARRRLASERRGLGIAAGVCSRSSRWCSVMWAATSGITPWITPPTAPYPASDW